MHIHTACWLLLVVPVYNVI